MNETTNTEQKPSFIASATMADCNRAFEVAAGAADRKRDSGAGKSVIPEFVSVMRRVIELSGRGSFTFTDVLRNAKYLDIPLETLKELFERYVQTLTALHKIEPIESIDEQVYIILN